MDVDAVTPDIFLRPFPVSAVVLACRHGEVPRRGFVLVHAVGCRDHPPGVYQCPPTHGEGSVRHKNLPRPCSTNCCCAANYTETDFSFTAFTFIRRIGPLGCSRRWDSG